MSRAAAGVRNLARRSVAALLIAWWLTGAVPALADTTTTSCASGENTSTTYCPALQGGTDDDSAVLAGFEAGGLVAFGAGVVVAVAGVYRRLVGAR